MRIFSFHCQASNSVLFKTFPQEKRKTCQLNRADNIKETKRRISGKVVEKIISVTLQAKISQGKQTIAEEEGLIAAEKSTAALAFCGSREVIVLQTIDKVSERQELMCLGKLKAGYSLGITATW